MEISVIIPCFNAELWIKEALRSLASQGISDMEIIVVDDGSTDDSARIVETEFPFVGLVKTKNQGPSKARNLGIKVSKGSFFQFLDADDLIGPGKIKAQLEILHKANADVAYCDWQKLFKVNGGEWANGEQFSRKIAIPEIELFTDTWFPPHAYLFRRSIVEKTNGWNEGLPIIQDARFALDCALSGGKFVYTPGPVVYYRIHSSVSVSRKDPRAFIIDCMANACDVEEWWVTHGGISEQRKNALLKVYGYIARSSLEIDERVFNVACQALKRLSPGYLPAGPQALRVLSSICGYREAEYCALWYRRAKRFLRAKKQ